MILAGTGHRPNKLGNEYDYKGPYTNFIRGELEAIIERFKPSFIICGMSIGFDIILALVTLKMNIGLYCYIPFKGQEKMWPESSQQLYHKILSLSNKIHIVDTNKDWSYKQYLTEPNGTYTPIKMNNRNVAMVNACDKLISCWDESAGGTANCINYAHSVIKPIIPINLNFFKQNLCQK